VHTRPTPEGCPLDLAPAGPMSRALAWAIDLALRLLVWGSVAQLLVLVGEAGFGLILLSGFALEWFMPVVFEVLWHGQTPGKRILGLIVLHDDGTPVGWQASFIRNAMRFVDMLPVAYAAGFLTTLLTADGKRLGDLVAGTIVVHAPTPMRVGVMPGVGAEAPAVSLATEERQAVMDYGLRVLALTEERALELATLPLPLVAGDDPEAARARLLRVANHLVGDR
jgi:uncharacterized RDD family membrane protein YckC